MRFLAEITGAEADMRLVRAFNVAPPVAVCIPAKTEEATVGDADDILDAVANRLYSVGAQGRKPL